jgi:hypothetical protein
LTYLKLSLVLSVEVAMAPLVFGLARRSDSPEAILALQNRARRLALRWLCPAYFEDSGER